MTNNPLDKSFDLIEELLELDPGNVKKGSKLGEELVESTRKIKTSISEQKTEEDLREILSSLRNCCSRLSRDVLNIEEKSLNSDWERFAKQDFSRLKDVVLSLKEFLVSNESAIRKEFYEAKYGMDVRELILEITGEENVDNVTQARLSSLVDDMEEDKLQAKVEKHEERLQRIYKWLLMLREVKNVGN